MDDDLKLGCIAMICLGLLIIGGALWLDSQSCHARFAGSGLQSDWGIMSGCRVNVPRQGWIPAENYRVL